MIRCALTPMPGSSRPWGRGNSRQPLGAKVPEERGVVGEVTAGEGVWSRGETRVEGYMG